MKRYLKLMVLAGVFTGAIGLGYLLGNYRSIVAYENGLKGYQISLNCLYMTILAEKGPQALSDRLVTQLNAAVADLNQASAPSFRKLVNASVFGKPAPDEPFRISAAWDLQVFKDRFPSAPFTDSTRQFIDQYSQYIQEGGRLGGVCDFRLATRMGRAWNSENFGNQPRMAQMARIGRHGTFLKPHPVAVALLLLVGVLALYAYWLLEPELQITRRYRAQSDEAMLKQALVLYFQANGELPSTAQSLTALVRKPVDAPAKWHPIVTEVPKDPWGRAYQYERKGAATGDGFRVFSFGPSMSDTGNDIELSYPDPRAQKTGANR